ncbi:limulus clotting factor C-like [Homalodisca vitripennis]|uniref:limulus clotting factor C-like n=1 Tax=Homalodisca vitripennis TaxID=197043 RepID=UPI001EE9E120|nr:limulus clotting factor C-like [Homalodisca vitripennis]
MKHLCRFYYIIILLSFGIAYAIWVDEDNDCLFATCEGEDCPGEDELCPQKEQVNPFNYNIKPLSNTNEIVDSNPNVYCEIHSYNRQHVTFMKCVSNNGSISCDGILPISTAVIYECAQFYKPVSKLALCSKSGKWSESISCIPDCGKTHPVETLPLILHGSQVEAGQWPWAAALFHHEPDNTWKLICGGTLISTNAVITAAHCIWKKPPKDLFVMLGHLSRKLPTTNRKDVIFQVKRFYLLPVYRDRINGWSSDIAILVLKTPAKLSRTILPACLPDKDNITISPYTMAIVSGWGKNEKYVESPSLYYAKIPIRDLRKCLTHIPQTFHQFLSYTTFCAGYINGTGVCNGDSGGGLLSKHNEKWELQGIVSVSSRKDSRLLCHPQNYGLFTKVYVFISWILEVTRFERKKLEEAEVQ